MCAAFTTVVPAASGLSVKAPELVAKVAVTARAALIVTLQVPVPVQLPIQPEKVELVAGTAVRVTAVLLVNDDAHAVPLEIPVGALVTVLLPAPALVTVSTKDGKANVALTLWAALIVTVQVLVVPVQPPPLQPVNVEPAVGVAVKVTAVPVVKDVEHVVPQEIPAGALVTVPVPVPALVTVRAKDDCTKLAVTEVAAVTATVQVPVPVQPPLQPVNVESAAGAAVKVTAVPLANVAEHELPQEMPVGTLVTVPDPAPALLTVSEKLCNVNVAVTEAAAFMVTVQVPVPVQPPPLQPENVEPAAGVAVNVTAVPVVKDVEHVVPQEIPVGALVTVPLPAPALETVRVEVADAPVPLTSRETVSPSAVKLTLVLASAVLVGVKRTVIVAAAPEPSRVKGLPEAMLNGAATEAVPVTVPVRVLVTAKV